MISGYLKLVIFIKNIFISTPITPSCFITGEILPDTDKNIGKTYASIQIYNFDKVTCKGKVSKNVPYFNVYPASDLWVDITRVE